MQNQKQNEQVIEKPVLEALRILGRMIAREIYTNLIKNKMSGNGEVNKKVDLEDEKYAA